MTDHCARAARHPVGHTVGQGTNCGVRIISSGCALPERKLTNADLEKLMTTSDEWIIQRTGISERRRVNRDTSGESTLTLAADALRAAITTAEIDPKELDLVLLATMTPEMPCPPTSSRLVDMVGATPAGAWDLNAACSGFVFGLNAVAAMMHMGMHKTVALVGADTVTQYMRYNDEGRASAILFGDAAGAIILRADNDPAKGLVAHSMNTDGGQWQHLFIPRHTADTPDPASPIDPATLQSLSMNGRAVFKFAVSTFSDLIQETLEKAGLTADQIDHYVCHQSNARILSASRERFGVPEEKMHVNIDHFGNTVSGSVPLVYHDLDKAGKIKQGQRVMFLGFGGGLTWGSSLWQF